MKNPETAALARAARERTGLTQDRFAALIWTSKRVVASWEGGEKTVSGTVARLLVAIRDGLDLPEVER